MFKIQINLVEGEKIELAKAANHYMGIEAVGGKLFITNKRIVFKSHSLNVQNHELSIEYADIQSVEYFKNLGFIPNGLLIMTKSGKHEKFVVWNRKTIKKLIEEKMRTV